MSIIKKSIPAAMTFRVSNISKRILSLLNDEVWIAIRSLILRQRVHQVNLKSKI